MWSSPSEGSLNKDMLKLNKVDVDRYTRATCIRDLKTFFEMFLPEIKDWGYLYSDIDVLFEFQPMTSTGLPKNVLKVSFHYDDGKTPFGRNYVVYFSYLADGSINSADASIWDKKANLQFKVRLKQGQHVITEIKVKEPKKESTDTVFKDNNATNNDKSEQLLSWNWRNWFRY